MVFSIFIMVLSMALHHQSCRAINLPQNSTRAQLSVTNITHRNQIKVNSFKVNNTEAEKIHSKRDIRKENFEFLRHRLNKFDNNKKITFNSSMDNLNLNFSQFINDQAFLPFMGKKEFQLGGPVALPSHSCPNFCHAGVQGIGTCSMPEDCYHSGGTVLGPCCGDFLICCQVSYQCGGTSSDSLVNFQSPHYPSSTKGTVACDFELNIREDVCAIRVDFVHVHLYGKFGGVCDVDQILILNSVDGPITSQCGELSGYATTVAVRPGQEQPLKIVIIAQNEGYYSWDIRLRQIRCNKLSNFRRPPACGKKEEHDSAVSFYQLLDLWRNAAWYQNQYMDRIWWRQPGPSFNRFFYEATMKAMNGIRRSGSDIAQDRIIGGTEAELHEFPWQVAIILKRVFFCGGALINDEFVLSAAHCFITQDTPVADLVVFLGDHDLTSSNDTISDVRGVKRVHFHSHFHAILLSNDIALLQLDRPVLFSQRIRPICLPDLGADQSLVGFGATVAGWGITSYPDGKPNAVLQKLDVQIISNEECESSLNENLGAGNLCAVPQSKQGTCFGDSGGPLTVTHQNKDILVGLVSFGITGCAVAPGTPDLYTRISEYMKWIEISTIKYFE